MTEYVTDVQELPGPAAAPGTEFASEPIAVGVVDVPAGEMGSAPNGTQTSRVCDYFVTERGCVKGDRCDFLHTTAKKPQSELAADAGGKKLCDFFLTDRGCVKEDRCDFLHPKAPNGTETKRVCEYFGSHRGCAKEIRCDFLHLNQQVFSRTQAAALLQAQTVPFQPPYAVPTGYPPQPAGSYAWPGQPAAPAGAGNAGNAGIPGMRPSMPTQAQATGNTRVCTFYQEPRGCAKEERCDFVHSGPANAVAQPAPQQVDPAMAQYGYDAAYYQAYGMQQPQAAAAGTQPGAGAGYGAQGFYAAPGQQGAQNAYLQDPTAAVYGSAPAFGAAPSSGTGGERVCSFYLTARGCRKGTRCDFSHPADGGGAKKASVRYTPY